MPISIQSKPRGAPQSEWREVRRLRKKDSPQLLRKARAIAQSMRCAARVIRVQSIEV